MKRGKRSELNILDDSCNMTRGEIEISIKEIEKELGFDKVKPIQIDVPAEDMDFQEFYEEELRSFHNKQRRSGGWRYLFEEIRVENEFQEERYEYTGKYREAE